MKPRRLVVAVPIACLLLAGAYYLSVAQSPDSGGSCVVCHTDAAALKSLVKVPKTTGEAGEG